MEEKYFLENTLPGMGMPTAFGPGADFSGINGYGEIWITNVIHQARVEVDEQGTEAGAATAIIFGNGTQPEEPLTFNVDHPFLFVIRERATDNILFMGKVADPTA
jgi:serpin B